MWIRRKKSIKTTSWYAPRWCAPGRVPPRYATVVLPRVPFCPTFPYGAYQSTTIRRCLPPVQSCLWPVFTFVVKFLHAPFWRPCSLAPGDICTPLPPHATPLWLLDPLLSIVFGEKWKERRKSIARHANFATTCKCQKTSQQKGLPCFFSHALTCSRSNYG